MVNRPAPIKKPSTHQNEEGQYSNTMPNYGNQYPLFQYPNGFGPFATVVGAAIAPAIVPVSNYYPPIYPETSNSTKSSKKKHSSSRKSSSKKSPKESDRKLNVVSHWPSSQLNSGNNNLPLKKDLPSNPVYFNFLNTYTPDQNYVPSFNGANLYDNQPFGPFNQFNSFNGRFIQSSYGTQPNSKQGNNGINFNRASNGQNSFTKSPFNGYDNPSFVFNGNLSGQFIQPNGKSTSSYATPKPNDKSEETEEEVRINRQPRT